MRNGKCFFKHREALLQVTHTYVDRLKTAVKECKAVLCVIHIKSTNPTQWYKT